VLRMGMEGHNKCVYESELLTGGQEIMRSVVTDGVRTLQFVQKQLNVAKLLAPPITLGDGPGRVNWISFYARAHSCRYC
jgi:hypothetical protein